MSPAAARPLLHTAHLLTFLLLLITGVLLFAPSLRAAIVGGYSLLIRQTHRWGGVAFVALPLLLVLRFGPRNVFVPPLERTLRTLWQAAHTGATLLLGLIFTATGFIMWGKQSLSDSLVDGSTWLHDSLTYIAAAMLVAHLLEIGGAAVVARISAPAAATAPPRP